MAIFILGYLMVQGFVYCARMWAAKCPLPLLSTPDRRREGFLSKSVLLIMLREAYTVRMPYPWIPIWNIGSITTAFELMAIFQD